MVSPEAYLITRKSVQEALDQLIQSSSTPQTALENPLQFLFLIDDHLLKSDFSFFEFPRKFALDDLLVNIVRDEYITLRSLYALAPVELGITFVEAKRTIQEDGATNNSHLIGWSWLYFHFVESTLEISQQLFCAWVSLDERTIRRYYGTSIARLVKLLIKLEQDMRLERHIKRLYLELPHKGVVSDLFERDEFVQLIRSSPQNRIIVMGAHGVGKTAFVELLVKLQIDNEEADRVVWIHEPISIQYIDLYLQEHLLGQNTKITLAEYTALRRTTIVIDGISNIQDGVDELNTYLLNLSNAYVFLTSQYFIPIEDPFAITLNELSRETVSELLSAKYANHIGSIKDVVQSVWQAVGGNPLAIDLLVQNLTIFDLKSAITLTLDDIFTRIFNNITLAQRLAWLILSLLGTTSVALMDFRKLESAHISFDDFVHLSRFFVGTDHVAVLSVAASTYIRLQYERDQSMRHLLTEVLEDLIPSQDDDIFVRLALLEATLSSDWTTFDIARLADPIERFWQIGLAHGHYMKWYVILGKFVQESLFTNDDIAIGYGVCQRNLGLWRQAERVFQTVANDASLRGDLLLQSRAQIEYVILLHLRGEYAAAIDLIGYMNVLLDELPNLSRERVLYEYAALEIERNNLSIGKEIWKRLPSHTIHSLIIETELYLRDDFSGNAAYHMPVLAEALLKQLFDINATTPLVAVRLHNLLGRVYEKMNDIQAAIDHLSIALSILVDTDNDPFALARTQSNLAALMISRSDFSTARDLLESAYRTQRVIGDRVGLATTAHNQGALARKIVS